MIYIVIYLVGFILTLISLLLYEKDLKGDYIVFFIISSTWLLTVPLKICFKIYYFIRDILRELFKEDEPYVDPWEEAVRDYRVQPPPPTKKRKNTKQFKFGR